MDPTIWSRLPEDLLDRILVLLPLETIVLLRPTCKRFNSLLLSPPFLSRFHHHHHSSFLLLSHPQFSHRHLPLYDTSSDCWRSLPLPRPFLGSTPSQPHLLSSSSGLLCFSLLPNHHSTLLISNLLTTSSEKLPSPVHPIFSATVIDPTATRRRPSPSPHHYKIFVPSSSSISNWVFVYDSATQSWTRFHGFDRIRPTQSCYHMGAFFNGKLYFTTPEPFLAVGFDLDTGNWEAAPKAGLPWEQLVFARLASSGEKLYVVGGVGSDGISRSVRVWELGGGGGEEEWVEVERVPEMMHRKFVSVCYHNYTHVYSFWHEGMVCLGCTTWPDVLMYKVGRRTWHWMVRCPLLREKWSCGFRWFSFVPDLYALV